MIQQVSIAISNHKISFGFTMNIDTDFIVIEEDEIPEHQKEKVKKLKGHKQIYELYERILYEKFTPEEQQSLKRIVRKEKLAKAAEANQVNHRSSTHNQN